MMQISLLTHRLLLDKDNGGTITDTLTVPIRCYLFSLYVGYQTHTPLVCLEVSTTQLSSSHSSHST